MKTKRKKYNDRCSSLLSLQQDRCTSGSRHFIAGAEGKNKTDAVQDRGTSLLKLKGGERQIKKKKEEIQ